MKRIKFEEFLNSVDFQRNMPYREVRELMNSNAQTVITMSAHIGM